MEEIGVGEYIRTNGGNIYQIRKIEKSISAIGQTIYWVKEFYLLKEDIKAHSKNIIDLIEVGDYVNGCLIVEISKDPFIKGQINLWTNMILSEGEPFPNEYYKAKIFENDIKTILTHEMYEQNCYKVGDIE